MTRLRRFVVTALIAAVLCCQVYSVVSFDELFPFSPFPMFAYRQNQFSASVLNAYAVTGAGPEFPLMTSRNTKYTFPLDGRLLQWSFEAAAASPDREERTHAMLRDLFDRYEASRRAGRHDGPQIQSIRIYRETWTLRFSADNADNPDSRDLVAVYAPDT